MSQLRSSELAQFENLADEIREVFSDRGFLIDTAVALDPAFRSTSAPQRALTRSLVADAVRRHASIAGWYPRQQGDHVSFSVSSHDAMRDFRLRRARKRANGEYVIVSNNSSSWGTLDEGTLEINESWAFGYTCDANGALEDVFAAEVVGIAKGAPGKLVFGSVWTLGTSTSTPPFDGKFVPEEDDLDWLEDEGYDADEGVA